MDVEGEMERDLADIIIYWKHSMVYDPLHSARRMKLLPQPLPVAGCSAVNTDKPPDLDFKARKCFGGTHVLFRHTA
eukprot:scaffold31866_cov67-Skeletonema_dohrnii-CCMP3373.AAC.1